jgi:thiamine pyrophosphate-dependent acetolactate synthase large subunit-like protein
MATTAADVLVETLLDRGVDTIFGLPGDGINGIMEALRTRQGAIRTPDAGKIALTIASDKVRELI